MSTPNTQRREITPPSDPTGSAHTELRVDAPHRDTGIAGAAIPPAAAEPGAEASSVEQLQLQLGQLANQLQGRQESLDHREALFNARLAQFEQSTREARLWLNEQETDLDARRQTVEQRQLELDRREQRLSAAEADDRAQTAAAADEACQREEILAQREAALDLRAELIAQQIAAHKADDRHVLTRNRR